MKEIEEILAELKSLVGEELKASSALPQIVSTRSLQSSVLERTRKAPALQQELLQDSRHRTPLMHALLLQSVSYKWLAREYELPVNLAKQLLFQFANEHRGKVNITYLLAGWTKEPSRQHTFQLVDGSRLQVKLAPPCVCLRDSEQMGTNFQMLFRWCMFNAPVDMCLNLCRNPASSLTPSPACMSTACSPRNRR